MELRITGKMRDLCAVIDVYQKANHGINILVNSRHNKCQSSSVAFSHSKNLGMIFKNHHCNWLPSRWPFFRDDHRVTNGLPKGSQRWRSKGVSLFFITNGRCHEARLERSTMGFIMVYTMWCPSSLAFNSVQLVYKYYFTRVDSGGLYL